MTSADPEAKPLRADAVRNRMRIVEAALDLFAQRGLSVALEDIAAHAGVGVGTLYRRFGERDALIAAVFLHRVNDFADHAEQAIDDPDPWQGLVSLVTYAGESFTANRGLAEVLTRPDGGDSRLMIGNERIENCLRTVFQRAYAVGALRHDLAATDLIVLLQMVAMVVRLTEDAVPGTWRRYRDLLLDSIRAGGRVPLSAPALTDDHLRIICDAGGGA